MRLKKLTSTLLLSCMCLALQAQLESKFTFRRYTTLDGLPQMQTERLFQDSRGYIYIGTLSGFVRFDGHGFTPFLKGRRYNIVDFAEVEHQVRAFDFRRQWLIDGDDVGMEPVDRQGHWLLNNFNSTSLPNGYVLLENEQETQRRLCRVTPEGMTTVRRGTLLDQMTPDRKLYMDSTVLYVPTGQGLYRVQGNRAVRLTAKGDVFTLQRSGNTLLALAADGVYRVESKGLRMVTPYDFSAVSYGLIVRSMGDGRLCIADEHSVYEYDGHDIRTLATGFNLVKDLLVDRWNRLWVATYKGLYCYFTRSFTTHRLTDADDIVRAIGVDAEQHVVMGTLNGKLLVDGKVVDDDPDNFYAPSAACVQGHVYMAANGDVVRVGGNGSMRRLQLPHDRYQFVAAADSLLVIGSRRCLATYNPRQETIDTLSASIPHPWCAARDAEGRLWVGTTFGLFVDGQKYDYEQQLIVTSMAGTARGSIFLASKDSLFVIRHGQVESLHIDELAGHEVRALHASEKGYLVVAVIDGLFVGRLDADERIHDVRYYNHTNGFTALEPLMATMAETDDGTVWLAGVEEVTSFRPEELLAYHEEDTFIAPPLHWWQHWWVWMTGLLILSLVVWGVARWYEKRRNRQRMIRLQREKMQRDEQIEAIRKKAISDVAVSELAKDIVQMTELPEAARLTLRTASGTIIVDVKDIAYFKGDGNYSQIVTFHDKDTVLLGLGALEKMLSPEVFVRADRSTLVNIHNVCQLLPKQRRCLFRSADGKKAETTLLAPAFKRLQALL